MRFTQRLGSHVWVFQGAHGPGNARGATGSQLSPSRGTEDTGNHQVCAPIKQMEKLRQEKKGLL